MFSRAFFFILKMNVFETYFRRFEAAAPLISTPPDARLNICVTIPCFNEPNLLATLKSLVQTHQHTGKAEVIVLINNSITEKPEIVAQNIKTDSEATNFVSENKTQHIDFHILYLNNFPSKHAGVGLARKTAMDEALHRFELIGNQRGIITGLDADCTVSENYFIEIENHFADNPDTNGCSLNFQHQLSGNEFEPAVYEAITNYELHLRYFKHAIAYTDFPFGFYTIGSSFAVLAETYAQQGGMNKKKAGEDFYFLQKIIALGKFSELRTATVFPSPRVSDRVPFGTGAAVAKILQDSDKQYFTYNFEAFEVLKYFRTQIDFFYTKTQDVEIHPTLLAYLKTTDFFENLDKIRANSSNLEHFKTHFFRIFNAFTIIRFLNESKNSCDFPAQPICEAAELLFKKCDYPLNNKLLALDFVTILRQIDC